MSTKASHKTCQALTRDEHAVVCALLPERCVAQAMAVVQVFGTWEPTYNTWSKLGVGVAVFSRDSERKGFFIQVYNIDHGELIFEQEVYREFEYHPSLPFFHQFEAEDHVIGFNFSSEADAEGFESAVSTLLLNRRKRRDEKRRKVIDEQKTKLGTNGHQRPPPPPPSQPHQQPSPAELLPPAVISHKLEKMFIKGIGTLRGEKKKKVRRELEIGNPFNFEHVSHAGFDRNFNVDAELVGLFEAVGLDQKKLANKETRDFVYDFIESHGGIEEARRASRKIHNSKGGGGHSHYSAPLPPRPPSHLSSAPPPPPERKPPTPPERRPTPLPAIPSEPPYPPPSKHPPPPLPAKGAAPKPPQQPSRSHSQYTVPPPPPLNPPRTSKRHSPPSIAPLPLPPLGADGIPPPSASKLPPTTSSSSNFAPPPPPPPLLSSSGPPPPPPLLPSSSDPPPPPPLPSSSGPPPPPPPLPSSSGPPPPPPPLPSSSSSSSSSDPRSALLTQIQEGKQLKKTQPAPSGPPSSTSSRSQLLDEIRNREFKLHHVETSETDSRRCSLSEPAGLEGIALDLHRALQERAHFIQAEDKEEEDSDDIDDDEWDDDD